MNFTNTPSDVEMQDLIYISKLKKALLENTFSYSYTCGRHFF